ncbi:manganese superoxide dismutase [Peziza echinospora]|nr:manganese superoxide dismutase [Peziza echinospora]
MSSEKQISFEQKKYVLPALPYAYDALEPYISKQIMELHHTKHHQAYVSNLNAALLNHVTALSKGDVKQQIEIQQMIKFNGGGHINHSLFWTNLTPAGTAASNPTTAAPKLLSAITKRWGSHDMFTDAFSKTLMGLQGSGWGWLVKDSSSGNLEITTTKDQDPVVGGKIPIIGVDMWEHAYYIQYYNDKASYVKGIWNIINWETAEKRYNGDAIGTKL